MAGKKKFLINEILILFMASMVLLSGSILIQQFQSYRNKFIKQSEFIKKNYNAEQRALIKREVERASDLIQSRMSTLDERVETIVKERVYEVYSIAGNIYSQYKGKMSDAEIIRLITEAVRPIRFSHDQGYFFITTMDGVVLMNANQPEIEGSPLLESNNPGIRKTMRDMIDILENDSEGLYRYHWTKPYEEGNQHLKISYIKHFEPYDLVIGTGLYTEDVKKVIEIEILSDVSQIRFGREGYIFINTLDGDTLISNGRMAEKPGKLWEQPGSDEESMKDLFAKELAMAQTPGGGYIHYEFRKLTATQELSSKVSFILGLKEFNWLIGAGVYLDDIDSDIISLQKLSYDEYLNDLGKFILIIVLIVTLFIGLLILIRQRLRRDFLIFDGFFDRAVHEDIKIDTDFLRFKEFSQMAHKANKMQHDKIQAQKSLMEGREKLKISENKFRLLAENSRDMIYRMSFPEGIFEYVSPASEEILGYTPAEIQQVPFFILNHIHPDWESWVRDKFKAMSNGVSDEDVEFKIIRKDGEEIWVSQKLNFIRDSAGQTTAIVGRLSNETKRKKVEEQLNQSKKLDAIGQLAGGVAHDFNNVLMGIINAAQYLKMPTPESGNDRDLMVDLIINAATRAADLTSKLSAFSRKRSLFLKPVDVHAIIDDTAVILKGTIDKKVSLKISLKATDSFVQGDAAELQSALMNLGINSSHALKEGGDILIETGNCFLEQEFCDSQPFNISPGKYIQIEIRDNGCGISPVDLPRIFEPYFSTKEQGRGTGLGLSTVYGAVFDHKGAVSVESEVNIGTSFFILLPCISEIPEKIKTPVEGRRRSEQILFVDDEPIIRLTGKSLLEKMGYTVHLAGIGGEALDIYKDHAGEIDLAIIDFMMPEMNGRELFYKLLEINPRAKIIMISGFTKNEDMERLRNDGLLGFLKKPFRYDELNKLISDIMD